MTCIGGSYKPPPKSSSDHDSAYLTLSHKPSAYIAISRLAARTRAGEDVSPLWIGGAALELACGVAGAYSGAENLLSRLRGVWDDQNSGGSSPDWDFWISSHI